MELIEPCAILSLSVTACAVSYTHLDVYKRQGVYRILGKEYVLTLLTLKVLQPVKVTDV